jgi:hypothetical protein
LPAIITSVARLMASTSDSRQPYRLSNLRFGDRIVDVERREREFPVLGHLIQALDAGGRLLGNALDLGEAGRIPLRIRLELGLDGGEQACSSSLAGLGEQPSVLLGLRAQVQQQRRIAAVVQDHVRVPPSGHSKMRCV